MRGEQFYRSQKKELLLCRKGWTKTRAWKISLHSPFTRFLIESRRKKEEKFPRFPQKGTYPSPSSPPLPPPPSFKPKNNKAKVANEEYSILILFHPSFFRPWTRKRRVYTYAAWDDGGRKGEMSTSVEITRRPVTRWHGAVACWNGRTQLGDVPTGKSDHTLRTLRRKYMILPVA